MKSFMITIILCIVAVLVVRTFVPLPRTLHTIFDLYLLGSCIFVGFKLGRRGQNEPDSAVGV